MNDYKELIDELRDTRHLDPLREVCVFAIEQLAKDNDVLTKERDAAVDDLNIARSCLTCKGDGADFCDGCDSWRSKKYWEWRGVQE